MKRKNSEIPADFPITKCPDGHASGADDLLTWGQRRATGRSGVGRDTGEKVAKKAKNTWKSRKLAKGRKRSGVIKPSYRPATTDRTDFSDMNVYDQSIPPWDENQVILEQR